MWRYDEMRPVTKERNVISLGEGMTWLFTLNKMAGRYGFSCLSMKDESSNLTGSFKARGISITISKAKEFEVEHCIIPLTGNHKSTIHT